MSTITCNPPAQVKQPDAADREVIEDLHGLGRLLTCAAGAHLANNAVTAETTPEEQAYALDIMTDLSSLSGNTTDEARNKEMLLGLCLHNTCAEAAVRSLENINVPFQAVADSITIDVSDKAAVEKKLAACHKYGLALEARFLQHKLDQ